MKITRIAVALATVAALSIGTSAAAATSHPAAGPRPTIVLVHGAWADGSSWAGEISRLQRLGYTVTVAPQPGRGPAADTAYLRDYLAALTGPVVLVGHSYGGFVITGAATGNKNVKALVYVDAFAPDEGESIAGLTQGSGSVLEPALTDPATVLSVTGYPGAPAGAGDSYILPGVFETGFAGDLPRGRAAVLAASQTPFATSAFGEPSTGPAWKTIPSWSVISRQDKVIPPAAERAMAARAHARVTEINGSHLSLISHPDEVTRVIVAAAAAR
ncbi:alpha/beta hydrolase [Actinoplanes sp. NPDC049596]|uniref:alpha/beta hydrolase n=1 Tax=unclassified Actinoplanes TaxID=2626549 RepID=UPI00342C41D2